MADKTMSICQDSFGYRLPAEWEPHAATWLAWPHRRATWLGDFGPIPIFFAAFARLLADYEPVRIVASGAALVEAGNCLRSIAAKHAIELFDIPTNDAWLRDTGPVFLVSHKSASQLPAAVAWQWNAWGGKYPPWEADAQVAQRIAKLLGMQVFQQSVVLEGGAIETDGEGTLLVNHRCVQDPARNPGLSLEVLEQVICAQLGIERLLWVGGELAGDDTDGHIDQLARFVAPGRVVAARQPDRLDPNHDPLEANIELLRTLVDAKGRRLEVIPIEIPSRFAFDGVQLPASFLNFYIANGVVAVPVFCTAADESALRTLVDCFPDRVVVPVACHELIRGRGGLHCITRDQPALQTPAML